MSPILLSQIRLTKDKNISISISQQRTLVYVSIGSIAIVLYLSIFMNWTMTKEDRILKERLTTFHNHYHSSKTSGADPFDVLVTEKRLSDSYPYNYDTNEDIENILMKKNIWQMWRSKKEVPYGDFPDKWKYMNPNFNYHFKTNDDLVDLIKQEFAETVPEIAETLELLPSLILKSDFSRYIILYLYGGTYSDLDVRLRQPMDEWFDTNRNVGFVCGTEGDFNFPNWNALPRRNQLQTWFIKSKPRHAILRKLIATIVKITFETHETGLEADYGNKHGEERCYSVDIMVWTGPAVFTDIVYAHLNSIKNPTIIDTNIARSNFGERLWGPALPNGVGISWKVTTGMESPLMVNDVVIYPQRTVRGGYSEYEASDVYISHYYSGSWKPS